MNKKKLLLVVPSLAIGGQEKQAVDTAEFLKEIYDVKIILFHKHETEYETFCEKVYLDVLPSKNMLGKILGQAKRALKLISIRRKEKIDVVYSFGETANITNVVSGMFSSGKSIVSIHGFSSIYKSIINNIVFLYADSIVCISKAMCLELKKIYPKIKNLTVIENGYNIQSIREKSKVSVNVEKGNPHFITMGRLEHVKGYSRLLNSFATVIKVLPSARLTLIGSGTQEKELQELCKNLKIEKNVTFLGFQKNPYAYLSKADVYVLSSYSEGFPNALIEALTCGLVCISVDCQTGPREILAKEFSREAIQGIKEEMYGILLEHAKDDNEVSEILAKAMIQIGTNYVLMKEYKDKAFCRAEEFSQEIYGAKIISLIEKL